MVLGLQRLRFTFQSLDSIHFPAGKTGNSLRGAFGLALRHLHCPGDCPGAGLCRNSHQCVYARIFEPTSTKKGPSGLSNWPRPFVIQAGHLDGCTFEAGERFSFCFNFFDVDNTRSVAEAFQFLETLGLGARRSRVHLDAITCKEIGVDLLESMSPVERMLVKFLSPTKLKGGTPGIVPSFGLLASRVRDRVSSISFLYGRGQVPIDFNGFGRRAALVATDRSVLVPIDAQRRSSRTGQVHSIGGFIGEAEYRGDLAEFVPFFRAAVYTGIGMKASWGNGQIEINYQINQ